MVKYYLRNGKMTKLGIKEHNETELERIAGYERAIETLEQCEITQVDRAPMIGVLEGYIGRHKEKLLYAGGCMEVRKGDIQAVLTQRSAEDGFYEKEIADLLAHLKLEAGEEVDPIYLDADSCILFGFIRMAASEELLSFETGLDSEFGRAAVAVANDMELERPDKLYDFAGVKTLMYY